MNCLSSDKIMDWFIPKLLIIGLLGIVILCLFLSGCAVIDFATCGDRGVANKYGFLWLKYKCVGDKYCEECKEWVHPYYDCKEACK
jgi:hypothetical protein